MMDELFEKLNTDLDGLTSGVAKARLERYGPNEITEKRRHPLIALLSKFTGPIPIMIEIAAFLSFLIKDYSDTALILFLLLLNVSVSFYQEHKTENILEELKSKLSVKARVKRDGRWETIAVRELAPGDIVEVGIGSIVPADMTLIEGTPLEIDQSMLTGESLPVDRGSEDEIYASSVVRQGEMVGVVTATGDKTYFGKTARLASEKKERSHFEKAVIKVGTYLIALSLLCIALITVVSLYRGECVTDVIMLDLTLAVASIPAALPAVMTVTMTVGAIALAHKNVLLRRIASIEELAGVDIFCSDKTGTLTQNILSMGDPIIFEGDEERLLKYALLASGFPQTDDLIDKAIGEGAEMKGVTSQELEDFKKIQYIPADSRRKRSTVFLKDPHGKRMVIIKGAPQVVLRRSKVSKELEALFNSHIRDLARRGYRAIAVGAGYTEVEDGLSLIGILPLRDPAREDAKDLIEEAAEMGIEVRLVTGDNRDVAAEIAAEIGIRGSSIYAEVLPEDKYDIVHKLQREGHFVAMTGDGVNDAPALKRADAGIAVSTANDITKSVADIVLTASGLGVIIDGIREGRTVFARMVHYATYRIAETIRLIAFITLTILIYGFFPMTPLQIVVLAILNDVPILMIAKDRAIAAKGPESWEMKRFLTLSTVMGFVGVLNSFILLLILMNRIDFPELQAAMFLKLSLTGHLLLLAVRNRGPWYSFAPSKSLLLAILLTMTVSTSMATFGIFIPRLDPLLVLGVWIYALIWWQITDLTKLKTYRVMER